MRATLKKIAIAIALIPLAISSPSYSDSSITSVKEGLSGGDFDSGFYGAVLNYCVLTVTNGLPLTQWDPANLQSIAPTSPDDAVARSFTHAKLGDIVWDVKQAKGYVFVLQSSDNSCRVMGRVPFGIPESPQQARHFEQFPQPLFDAIETRLLDPMYGMKKIPTPSVDANTASGLEVESRWYEAKVVRPGETTLRTVIVRLYAVDGGRGKDDKPHNLVLAGIASLLPDAP